MMAPALSMAIFNAIAKKEGCEVRIFETTHYSNRFSNRHIRMAEVGATYPTPESENIWYIKPRDKIIPDFRHCVEEYRPDLMLISVQEDVWGTAQDLLASVKDLEIEHLLGGVFVTSAPALVLSSPLVHRIALQEGERTVLQAIRAIKDGTKLDEINGIWWKDRFGLTHKNPPQPLCDITEVTPDFDCFEKNRWQRPMGGRMFRCAVSMETYRGCPYNCTYCNSPSIRDFSKKTGVGNYMRRKSAAVIERDLKYYLDFYGDLDLVMFQDDSFLARPKKEIFEFCEMWARYKIPFWFNTRIENCAPDVLSALKTAGAYRMTFGVESGNEEYRTKILQRPATNRKYLEYFDYINESNIPYSLNVILGMPFETKDMVLETADLVHASRGYDALTISIWQPYHGTSLRKLAVDAGFIDPAHVNNSSIQGDGGYLDNWVVRMPEPYLQPIEVDALVRTFSLYAYFDRDRWPEIQLAESDQDLYHTLMQEYRDGFFSDIHMGGRDRIDKKTCVKHDATSTYDFQDALIETIESIGKK